MTDEGISEFLKKGKGKKELEKRSGELNEIEKKENGRIAKEKNGRIAKEKKD